MTETTLTEGNVLVTFTKKAFPERYKLLVETDKEYAQRKSVAEMVDMARKAKQKGRTKQFPI